MFWGLRGDITVAFVDLNVDLVVVKPSSEEGQTSYPQGGIYLTPGLEAGLQFEASGGMLWGWNWDDISQYPGPSTGYLASLPIAPPLGTELKISQPVAGGIAGVEDLFTLHFEDPTVVYTGFELTTTTNWAFTSGVTGATDYLCVIAPRLLNC